jgi:hypothetical protein
MFKQTAHATTTKNLAAVNYHTWSGRFARKQESGSGMAARNNTMEGQYSALIHTNKEPLKGSSFPC